MDEFIKLTTEYSGSVYVRADRIIGISRRDTANALTVVEMGERAYYVIEEPETILESMGGIGRHDRA